MAREHLHRLLLHIGHLVIWLFQGPPYDRLTAVPGPRYDTK
jgi:hypothetical protein